MNFRDFEQMHGAYFRPLGANDGIPEWMEWVEGGAVDSGIMRLTLLACDDYRQRMAAERGIDFRGYDGPRLGEVQATYRRIVGGFDPVPGRKRQARPLCGNCGAGHLWFIVDIARAEMADIRRPRTEYSRNVTAMRSVCPCQDDVNGEPGELPPSGHPYFATQEQALLALAKWEGRTYNPAELDKRRSAVEMVA